MHKSFIVKFAMSIMAAILSLVGFAPASHASESSLFDGSSQLSSGIDIQIPDLGSSGFTIPDLGSSNFAPLQIPGAPSSQPQPSTDVTALRSQVIDETNTFRKYNGGPRITQVMLDNRTHLNAQAWADELARTQSFYHDPKLNSVDNIYAENIYMTGSANPTAQEIVNAWANSPGHRANMLQGYNRIGVGISRGSNGMWYVVARYYYEYSHNDVFLRQ